MHTTILRCAAGAAVAAVLSVAPVLGAAGDASFAFLKVPVDARAVAMGEAQAGLPRGSASLYWNPAGLAGLQSWNVALMHNVWLMGSFHDYLSGAMSFGRVGTFALAANYMNSGLITDAYDREGNDVPDFLMQYLATGVGYGHYLIQDVLDLGGAINLLYANFADETGATVAFDLGLLYHTPLAGLSVGGYGKNLGPGVTIVNTSEPLPATVGLGAGYAVPIKFPSNVTLDAYYSYGSKFQFGVGWETTFWDMVTARIGYKYGYDMEGFSGLRAGVGFAWKWLGFDYAFVPMGELGYSHRFSLTFSGDRVNPPPATSTYEPLPETTPATGDSTTTRIWSGDSTAAPATPY